MTAKKAPVTPAIRLLRQHGVSYQTHLFDYQPHGGAAQGARELDADPHSLVKTLILEDDKKQPLIVLMHGDREVSTRQLARTLGARSTALCDPAVATRHSGYQLGGTSPFATRRPMPVYLEASIVDLPRIFINGGKRGFLLSLDPQVLVRLLTPTLVKVAVQP